MIIRSWWSARWGWHLATNSKQAQARSRESLFESVGRQVRMIRIFFLELNWVLKWSEMYLSNRDQYIAVLPPSQMMISIFQEKWEPPVWSRQLTSSFKASMSHLGWVNFSYKSSHFLLQKPKNASAAGRRRWILLLLRCATVKLMAATTPRSSFRQWKLSQAALYLHSPYPFKYIYTERQKFLQLHF